jgi:mRNA-degrading endonuclease toxin of MazEF toxin-antitoxin module
LVGVTIAKKDAVAVVDQIRAVAKERLQRRVATLSMTELSAVENGLREVLEL